MHMTMDTRFVMGLCIASSVLLVGPACSDEGTDSDASETSGDGDGDTSGDGDGDTSGDGDGEGMDDPLADMVEFLGGEQALSDLSSFRITATGTRSIAGEGQSAGDPALQTGTFESLLSYDLGADAARIDYERIVELLGGVPLSYAEIYNGELGYVAGDDAILVPGPTDAPMQSSRWASGRLQMAYFNPHLLVRELLAGERTAQVSEASVEGCDSIIERSDPISPINLCVLEGGELAGLSTLTNDFLLRDVELQVLYSDWSGEGVPFPQQVEMSVDAQVYQSESRSVEVDVELDAAIFELPEGGMFDMQIADFGAISHQFFQSFSAIGLPLDFPMLNLTPTELAPGVFHISGGSHHSMVVEQDGGVVVIEAPNYPERADAILAWVAEQFPNKSVTHVIATHHHEDHTAGLRSFVAAGATVVLHEGSQDYFAERVFAAPSTLAPDALSSANLEPIFAAVGVDGLILDDASNPISLGQLANGHCTDMLLIHVDAGGGIVFNSDLYNPGNGGSALSPVGAQELLDAIEAGPDTALIAGGHGGVAPLSELQDFLAP